jgi:hypothetical protein
MKANKINKLRKYLILHCNNDDKKRDQVSGAVRKSTKIIRERTYIFC